MSFNESSGPPYVDTPTTPLGMSPSTVPRKPRIKLYISLGVIAGIALLMLIAWLWYSRPSKVLGDALNKAFTAQSMIARGSLQVNYTQGKQPASAASTFTTQSNSKGQQADITTTLHSGTTATKFETNVTTVGATSYFRAHNAPALATQLEKTSKTDKNVATVYNAFAASVNDKWVRVDTPAVAVGSVKSDDCTRAAQSFSLSKKDQVAVKQLFNQHQFLERDISGGAHQKDKMSGTHYYAFILSKYPAIQFYKETSKLDSFKPIFKSCKLPVNSLESDTTTLPQTSIELWVTQWSHQPTRIALQVKGAKNKLNLDTHLSLNSPVQISAPKDTVPLTTALKGATAKAVEAILEQNLTTPR